MSSSRELLERVERLNRIGIALSWHRDTNHLLETILDNARALTGADGGTLYLVDGDDVSFEIMQTDSLGIKLGGKTGNPIPFEPLKLHVGGRPNRTTVVTCCVLDANSINVTDTYQESAYDFSGTRRFDEQTGYDTRSLLAIPMRDHDGRVIAALQLINALDRDGRVVAFSEESHRLAESLASQAALVLTNKRLVDELRNLFESFVRLIAGAIDEKSPYTGAHCRRVPELTLMLADAAHRHEHGPLQDFRLDDKERYALEIAAWLHDCGKITTPEHVMDKSTKLEKVRDGIDTIEARAAVCRAELIAERDARRADAVAAGDSDAVAMADRHCRDEIAALEDDLAFLREVNLAGEGMTEAGLERIGRVARRRWTDHAGIVQPLLTRDEVNNLCISRGTLNEEERGVIENHAKVSIRMLEQLPFPPALQNVPEYAGAHHERVDGKGYPRGLTREQMSVPARAMAIADIFEALSAHDRPYKEARTLSECLQIMGRLRLEGHIDPDLFEIFVDRQVYRRYAEDFLDPSQIDRVDPDRIPGYRESSSGYP